MASICFAQITPTRQISAIKVQKLQEPPGSEACASCHSDIYHTYKETAMAKASGPAADGLVTGEFLHKPSGVHYRVYQHDGKVWMSYEREGKDAAGQKEGCQALRATGARV
jgi:hypothetical protein